MTMTGKLDGRHKHWLGRKVIGGGGWMDGWKMCGERIAMD